MTPEPPATSCLRPTSLAELLERRAPNASPNPSADAEDAARTIVDAVRTEGEPALRRYTELFGERTAGDPLVLDRSVLDDARDHLAAEERSLLERAAARICRLRSSATSSPRRLRDSGPRWSCRTARPGGPPGRRLCARRPVPSAFLGAHVGDSRPRRGRRERCGSPDRGPIPRRSRRPRSLAPMRSSWRVAPTRSRPWPTAPASSNVVTWSSGRATSGSPRPSDWCRATSASIRSPVPPNWSSSPTTAALRRGWPRISWRRPSTIRRRGRSWWCSKPDRGGRLAERVERELSRQLSTLSTGGVARQALANGGVVRCADLDQVVEVCEALAPEHLQLSIRDAARAAPRFRNYGAMFLGERGGEGPGRLRRRSEPHPADQRDGALLLRPLRSPLHEPADLARDRRLGGGARTLRRHGATGASRRPRRPRAGGDSASIRWGRRRGSGLTGRAKTSRPPFGIRELYRLLEDGPVCGGQDELRDPVAAANRERFASQIDQQHHQFPAVVAVDRTGRVDDGDPVAQGHPAAGPNLALPTRRNLQAQAGRVRRRVLPGARESSASTAARRSLPALPGDAGAGSASPLECGKRRTPTRGTTFIAPTPASPPMAFGRREHRPRALLESAAVRHHSATDGRCRRHWESVAVPDRERPVLPARPAAWAGRDHIGHESPVLDLILAEERAQGLALGASADADDRRSGNLSTGSVSPRQVFALGLFLFFVLVARQAARDGSGDSGADLQHRSPTAAFGHRVLPCLANRARHGLPEFLRRTG